MINKKLLSMLFAVSVTIGGLQAEEKVAFSGYVMAPNGKYMQTDRGIYQYEDGNREPVVTGQDFFIGYAYNTNFAGGTFFNNKYAFVANVYSNAVWKQVTNYYVYDFDTQQMTVTPINASDVDYTAYSYDVTWDPVTEEVYGSFFSADRTKVYFGKRDKLTGQTTFIAEIEKMYVRMSADFDGQLWGIDQDMNLVKIDKTTGQPTIIGATGIESSEVAGSCFDLNANKYYVTNSNGYAGDCALYDIDLTTGAATKVADIYGRDQVFGIYMPIPEAKPLAPAAVTDLTVDFGNNGSLTGTVAFSTPTTTFDGTATLEGNIDVVIEAGATSETISCAAGQSVSHQLSLPAAGNYTIKVYAVNTTGRGPKQQVELWVGDDVPDQASNIRLVRHENTAQLSWEKPLRGQHDGYLNESRLTYKVVRILAHKTDTVASGLTSTSFNEQVDAEQAVRYQYAVVPCYDDCEGTTGVSNTAMFGPAFQTPVLFNFDTENDIDLFSVYDHNNDGKTWENGIYANAFSQNIRCVTSNAEADDWIVTPDVSLEGGKTYRFSFCARGSYSYTRAEHLEAYMGNGSGLADMVTRILPDTALTNDYQRFTVMIHPESSGRFNFGIHAISPYKANTNDFFIYADSIFISEGKQGGEPSTLTNVKAVAAEGGMLSVNISFVAPTTTFAGEELQSIDKVYVYNADNELVGQSTNVAPGAEVTISNVPAVQGDNTYKLYAVNAVGEGESVMVSVYAGIGIPQAVNNLALNFNDAGQPQLVWDNVPEISVEGYYVDPLQVSYTIGKRNIGNDGEVEYLTAATLEAGINEWTDTESNFSGEQRLMNYVVVPQNIAGSGEALVSNNIVVGDSYASPFFETVDGKENHIWQNFDWNPDYNTAWRTTGYSADEDEDDESGCFVFPTPSRTAYTGYTPDSCTLYSGKISLQGLTFPVVKMQVWGTPGSNVQLYIQAAPNGCPLNLQTIGKIDFLTVESSDFEPYSFSLSPFAEADHVILGFKVVAVKEGVFLDCISVESDPSVVTGINECRMDGATPHIYSIGGKPISHLKRGINVVRQQDGSYKKIIR